MISLAYGALAYYGVKSSEKKKNPDLTDKELHEKGMGTAVIGGTVIMLTGIGLSISNKGSHYKTENISTQQFDKWLNDYNKKEKQRYIKYQEGNNGYLIIPKDKVSAYEAEERRRREEVEKQRLERERELALKKEQEEEAAYKLVMEMYDRKYWIAYFEKFPDGHHREEVLEEAEEQAFDDVVYFYDRGAWETYVKYFPDGKNIKLVKAFEKWSKRFDVIMDGPNLSDSLIVLIDDTPYSVATKRLKDIGEFEIDFNKWIDDEVSFRGLKWRPRSTISGQKRALEKIIEKGDERRRFAENLVLGDNLCLIISSVRTNERGEEIKGTEGKTRIRLIVDALNEDKSRISVTVKEIYNITQNSKSDRFTFGSPRRVWETNSRDWIDPADWDLEYCK